MTLYQIFLEVLMAAGALGCLAFVITYHVQTGGAWLKSEAGRFLMIVYGNLFLLFTLLLVNSIIGPWPGRQLMTVLLFSAFCVFTWWPLRLLVKYNKRNGNGG